ncbi:MAG: rod-binding protein [Tissierellales bacterium]|jgi:flagellar protein FlgJ|nr:rod-binding protein [Tissierellales bacterium]
MEININQMINQAKLQTDRGQELNKIQDKFEGAKNSSDDESLMQACKDFEAIFMDIVYKEMQSTITDGGLTDKSYARGVYEDMLSEELSKETTKDESGIGLAKMIYDSMKMR